MLAASKVGNNGRQVVATADDLQTEVNRVLQSSRNDLQYEVDLWFLEVGPVMAHEAPLTWFARALRAEQKHRQLSQRGLATLLDKRLMTVQRWLTGERLPAFPELNHVAAVFGWDLTAGLPPHVM